MNTITKDALSQKIILATESCLLAPVTAYTAPEILKYEGCKNIPVISEFLNNSYIGEMAGVYSAEIVKNLFDTDKYSETALEMKEQVAQALLNYDVAVHEFLIKLLSVESARANS